MDPIQEQYNQAMEKGHSAAWDQDWDRAVQAYQLGLNLQPNSAAAANSLGMALAMLEEYEAALQAYGQGARISPEDPLPLERGAEIYQKLSQTANAVKAYLAAADLYLQRRDLPKSIELYTVIIDLQPTHLVAHSRLALIFEKTGKKQQAVQEYLQIAALLQSAGNVEKARQTLEHALVLLPDSLEVASSLRMLEQSQPLPLFAEKMPVPAEASPAPAETERQNGGEHEAADPIEQAMRTALSDLASRVFEYSGKQAEDAGSSRSLQSFLSKSAPNAAPTTDEIFQRLGKVVDLIASDRRAAASVELESLIAAGLDLPAVNFILGSFYAQDEKISQAEDLLAAARPHAAFALGANLALADVYIRQEKKALAVAAYLEALRVADSLVVPEQQANSLRELYDPIISQVVKTGDEGLFTRISESIAELLVRKNWLSNLQKARQELPPPLAGAPPMPLGQLLSEASSGKVVEAIANVHRLANAGHLRSAMEEAYYALQHAPSYLPLHEFMAELLSQQGRNSEATNKYKVIAEVYSARGNHERSAGLYQHIINQDSTDLDAQYRLIEEWQAMGCVKEAIEGYRKIGEALYAQADLENSRLAFSAALRIAERNPEDQGTCVQILHQIADLDQQNLDWRQAIQTYETIRRLDPLDQAARTALVNLYFRTNQAGRAISEADHFLLERLRKGNRKDALQFIKDLIEDNPGQPDLERRLDMLHNSAQA